MSDCIKILSIDGGGIRGIIPALVLDAIEQRTGKPIAALFDMIAGTSTGGIIAAGLAAKGPNGGPVRTAKGMAEFYTKRGSDIFKRSFWRFGGYLNEKAKGWGMIQWASPIIGCFFDGTSDAVDHHLKLLLPDVGSDKRYYHFQTDLDKASGDLDNASPENIRALELEAQDILRDQAAELDELCQRLLA